MTAELSVIREGFGLELRRGTFEIIVDDTNVGKIEYSETVKTPVEPGRHTLKIQAGRYSSRVQAFDAEDGGAINFRCHGAMVWPRYVLSAFMPDMAIALRRE